LEHLLATNFLLDPIVGVLENALRFLNTVTHNFGLSLVILAVAVKLVFWPLNSFQFKSITKMQALQPRMKALQAKYKNDQQKLQQETMALYKETGVNPFASCLPLLLQMPILYSLYYAINSNKAEFATTKFLWIGTPFSETSKILAASLAQPDYVLLALYVVSMYFSVRLSSPAMDEQQAQQQKIMAFVSPVMIAFIGRFWPSALILYWLTFNLLTMAQQFYLMRRYAPKPALAEGGAGGGAAKALAQADDVATAAAVRPDGSPRSTRRKRGSRR